MKLKNIILLVIAVVLFGSCVPVPSYSVDSYIGSLNQCLNIEGTYENENYYRNYPNEYLAINTNFIPALFSERKKDKNLSSIEELKEEKKIISKKQWITFRRLDKQRLETTLFNVEGYSLVTIIDMQRKKASLSRPIQSEEFTCNQASWQRSYSEVFPGGESGRSKNRIYSKTTKLSDGTLRIEAKYDTWGGG